MRLGETVIHDGRPLVLRGVDPLGVSDPLAEVEDPATGEQLAVPLDELEPAHGTPAFSPRGPELYSA